MEDFIYLWAMCCWSLMFQGAPPKYCLLGPITYLIIAFDRNLKNEVDSDGTIGYNLFTEENCE